ncbi:MAG: Ig domain-containing protein [Clostridia bacterium]|nr:Ig domain-containing protein [Clostridia bacterium]
MLKRIICGITVVSMLFLSTITSYAVLPQNMSGDIESGGAVLVFHDDFTHGSGMWTVSNMTVSNGKVTSPDSTSSNIKFYDTEIELTDADYYIKFSPVNWNEGLAIIDVGDTPKYRVIIRESGISLAPVGMTEQPKVAYPLNVGTNYEIRISEAGGSASISVRQEGFEEYTSIGMVSGTDAASGFLTISGNKYAVDFKEVTVYDTSSKSVAFTERYRFVNINEPTQLGLINKTEKEIIYTSSDTEIAEIDENGIVTAKTNGKVTITAATADGNTTDTCNLIVYVPVTAIAVKPEDLDLYVGQSEVVNGQFLPKNATNTAFMYESSNPEVLVLNGGNNQYQSVTALAPGEATIKMISPDGIEAELKVVVLPKEEPRTNNAVFSLNGFSREIPERYFGVHHARLMNDYPMNKKELDPEYIAKSERLASELIKDVGFGSVRSYWTWWNWQKAGKWNNDNSWTDLPNRTTIEQIYQVTRDGGAKHVLAFSVFSTVDEMVEEFLEIKRVEPNYEIYIEYGNETYAINEKNRMPTVEEYIKRLGELRTRIKEIDPTAKIAVPILDYRLERAIFNDPNNYPDGEANWEYTQGIRALTWNAALSENSDLFDAVIPHMYVSADKLRTNQQNYLKNVLKNMQGKVRGTLRQEHQFPGKEVWVTEYGFFPQALNIGASGGKYRDMEQDGKSLGAAIVSATSALMLLDTNTTVTSLHYMIDPQGFGIAQFADAERTGLSYLPHYYLYKELGKLFNGNSHYYGLTLEEGVHENAQVNYNQEKQYVDQPDLYVYGFGNKNGVQKIAIVNLAENPANVKIEGTHLKPVMQYWSDNPWPDLHTWEESYTAMPKEIPLPEQITDAEFADSVEIKPFSVTVVEVSGGEKSRIAQTVSEKLGEYVVYKKDSARAYEGISRRDLDPYQQGMGVKTVNGKTYVPMRSLEKLADQFVTYTQDENGLATFSIMEYRHLKEEKEIEADVSKVTSVETGLEMVNGFYWNTTISLDKASGNIVGESVVRDNKVTIDAENAPIMLDGTTYITMELAADILGYSVNYYDNGLVVLSQNSEQLTADELQSITDEYAR